MSDRVPFHEQVARKFIEQLKNNTAPWQKPWMPRVGWLPFNPNSGKRYRGINALLLMSCEREDPRWMSYKQAKDHGYQVRKGEKGVGIEYWLFPGKFDENGNLLRNADGSPVNPRPRVFYSTVFNAGQIDGIPPLEARQITWNPVEKAEVILKNSGARIQHSEYDAAFYSLLTDSIYLPRRDQFKDAEAYYSTALHELGHWTGHSSRLDRKLTGDKQSLDYAKEELRAEIASVMMSEEVGITHDPTRHVAYVKSWIKALQNDPREIFRAAADAEKIQTYLMGLHQREQVQQSIANPMAVAMKI